MPPTNEQLALRAILAQRNARLERIYGGFLTVYYQEDNPERFPLSAHCMRELLAKCPSLIGEEWFPQGVKMGTKLKPVIEANQALKKAGYTDGAALDAMAGQVRDLLNAVDEFLQWNEENRPKSDAKIARLLAGLSGPGQPIAVDVARAEVRKWKKANDYFNGVAHHNHDTNEAEFLPHATFVETLLRLRLQPEAVQDHDEIDALIAEAEHGNG
jgi:hypothetical protein